MTSDPPRYGSSAALRTALEEHLRQRATSTGTPLDRLRKEVAHQRLLARLVVVAPRGSWALEGGQALLARLDTQARATKDADTTWRAALEHFDDVLEAAVDTDLGDGFHFEVAAPRPMTAETDEGGLRYPVLALLDGREFERIQLDVNAVPDDQRPVDSVALRDLLGFAGIAPPQVPVIPVGQHLAEKLHAYTRDYGSQSNSRPRDLYDMLVIARSLPVPVPTSFGEPVARRSPYDTLPGRQHSQTRRQVGPPHGSPTSATTTSPGATSTRRAKHSHRSGCPCSSVPTTKRTTRSGILQPGHGRRLDRKPTQDWRGRIALVPAVEAPICEDRDNQQLLSVLHDRHRPDVAQLRSIVAAKLSEAFAR